MGHCSDQVLIEGPRTACGGDTIDQDAPGVMENIEQPLDQCIQDNEARRQSAVIAAHAQKIEWSEQCPDWPDWTA